MRFYGVFNITIYQRQNRKALERYEKDFKRFFSLAGGFVQER